MRFNENPIWKQLENFTFNASNQLENYTKKLAQRAKWTTPFTNEVIEEYKKFLFLAATEKCILVPPPPVDLAWKMHIEYFPLSWKNICSQILGIKLKRANPPKENDDDPPFPRTVYYNQTLKIYSRVFHTWPSATLWPTSEEWFKTNITLPLKRNSRPVILKLKNLIIIFILTAFIISIVFNNPWIPTGMIIMTFLINTRSGFNNKYNYIWDDMGYTDYEYNFLRTEPTAFYSHVYTIGYYYFYSGQVPQTNSLSFRSDDSIMQNVKN